MRRSIVKLTILFALLCALPAQALTRSSSYIPDDCGNRDCTCFIQLGDTGNFVKGIIKCLKEQGYLGQKVRVGQFTEEVEAAVIRFQKDGGLPPTGTMDDDTLTLLVWGMLPLELDEVMPVARGVPSTYPDMVYVPTDGGKRRHGKPDCSGMYNPRKVSIRNADRIGFKACKICELEREQLFLHR